VKVLVDDFRKFNNLHYFVRFCFQELLQSLKSKLEVAEKARQDYIKNGGDLNKPKTKVITKIIMNSQPSGKRKKDKLTETHKDGERVRYFPDDDKYTLKSMVNTLHARFRYHFKSYVNYGSDFIIIVRKRKNDNCRR